MDQKTVGGLEKRPPICSIDQVLCALEAALSGPSMNSKLSGTFWMVKGLSSG
jgi:hypothetical protein